jgi:choice-of-anchor B domain-containing protein
MKKILFICLLLICFCAQAQSNKNIHAIANFNDTNLSRFGVDGGDIWNDCAAWHDPRNNREYAIAGSTDSIYFFDITDNKMVKSDVEYGSCNFATNRDYEVYQHYVYCVSDRATGVGQLQIFDLNYLPDSVHKVYESNSLSFFTHTIFIDSASKRMYMCSNTKTSGLSAMDVVSLADPINPVFLAELDVPKNGTGQKLFTRVHEMYARNDTVYLSCEYPGLFIYDLRNLNQQKILSVISNYPQNGYNHSSWLDDSGKYLMFTDENQGLSIKMYDVSDITNPKFVSVFNSSPQAMPHNAFWKGKYGIASSYQDGVVCWNLSDPYNPIKAGWFDTYQENSKIYSGFKGCWGVYPYLPSNKIIASDLRSGIWVLKIDSSAANDVNELEMISYLNLFPNPFKNIISINTGQNLESISISDIQGKVWVQKNLKLWPRNNTFEVDTENWPAGIYFAEVITDKGRTFKKAIKIQGE